MGCCASWHGSKLHPAGVIMVSQISNILRLDGIRMVYKFEKVIGHGAYGTIRRVVSIIQPSRKFAVKSIAKAQISGVHALRSELEVLVSADHPNIVKVYEAFEDAMYVHIVMELCQGGDLYKHVLRQSSFSEVNAVKIMRKLFSAVNYLHSIKVAHRDLKFENILAVSESPDSDIRVIDFGLSSQFCRRDKPLKSIVGTAHYMAPEMHTLDYDNKCDIWSLGVLMYQLLTGDYPFSGKTQEEIFRNAKCAKLDFTGKHLSGTAADLISRLLKINPKHRISLKRALYHPWITKNEATFGKSIEPGVFEVLKNYKNTSLLKKEAARVILRHVDTNNIEEIKRVFEALDIEKNGQITATDIKLALEYSDLILAQKELGKLLSSVTEESNVMGYTDFLIALCDRKILETEENLHFAFEYFAGPDQHITVASFQKGLNRGGRSYSEEEITDFGNSWISYSEFKEIIQANEQISPLRLIL